jgi:hypothetical protein
MDELELRLASMRAIQTERQLRHQAEQDKARVEHSSRMLQRALQSRTTPVAAEERPCTLGGATACPRRAEVKLADLTGFSAWACLDHAGEALSTIPGAFVATHDAPSITSLNRG